MKPRPTFVATGVLTAAATALQVVKPAWVQGALGNKCESGAGAALLACVSYVDDLKTANPLGLTMGHGFLLKAIAEVLAQVIPQAGSPMAWLDPLRVLRGTIAGLLSSSLTFFYWTRLPWVRALKAPQITPVLRIIVPAMAGQKCAQISVKQQYASANVRRLDATIKCRSQHVIPR